MRMFQLALLLVVVLLGLIAVGGVLRDPRQKDTPSSHELIQKPDANAPPASGTDRRPPGKPSKKLKGTFTISKETTYATGPLDTDGCVDYAAALHERRSMGVSPENNADALIWRALGPDPIGLAPVPSRYFELLGIPPPAERERFVTLTDYLKAHNATPDEEADVAAFLNRAVPRPWGAHEQPRVASWLKANEQPLALVVRATRQNQDYSPLVPAKTGKRLSELWAARAPTTLPYRELVGALVVRAMLAADQRDPDAAWKDLLACHRLARMIARGGTVAAATAGLNIEQGVCLATVVFLDHTKPDSQRIERYLRDLNALPPRQDLAELVDIAERFKSLDVIMQLAREGSDFLKPDDPKEANLLPQGLLDGIDCDPAFEKINRWFNRLVAAMKEKNRGDRDQKLAQVEEELLALRTRVSAGQGVKPPAGMPIPKAAASVLGDLMGPIVVPKLRDLNVVSERTAQTYDNTITAFALAWYQRETGRYPDRLDALAPKYLKEVPPDLFSDGALIYRPSPNGYLLYSVGANGRDDGGHGFDDQPPGDDLVVRMPLPQPR
jgi:hypothetical protein